MKKNLRVFVSSFMVGVMTATSTGIPALSAVSAFAAEDGVVDEVVSAAAVEAFADAEATTANEGNLLPAVADAVFAVGATIIDNDNISAVIPATQAKGFKYVADDPTIKEYEGKEYTFHYQTGGTNTAQTSLDGGAVATFREALEFTAKKDGVLSIDCKVNDGKVAAIVTGNDTDGFTTVQDAKVDNTDAAAPTFETLSVTLAAGDSVKFVGKGTNVPVYSVEYSVSEESKTYDLADPEKGVVYTANFSEIGSDSTNVGSAIDGVYYGDNTIVADAPGGTYIHGTHGAAFKPGDKLAFKVAGDAKISMVACVYGSSSFTVANSKGEVIGTFAGKDTEAAGHENEADGTETAQVIDYTGDADTLTVTFDPSAPSETYVHKFSVKSTAPAVDYGLADPEPGKVYTADFIALDPTTAENPLNGMKLCEDTMIAIASENSNIRNDAHGTTSKPGDKFVFKVGGNSEIRLTACVYGHNTWTLTDSKDNVIGVFNGCNKEAAGHDQEPDGSETAQVIKYKGDADTLTLTYDPDASGETYVHKLEVEGEAKATGKAENFSVWFDDMATPVEGAPDPDGNPTTVMTFDQQILEYGDSTLTLVGMGDTKFTPDNNKAMFVNITRGDRVCNAYKAGARNKNCNDLTTIPVMGDGTALVFKCVGNGTFMSYCCTGSFVRVWDFNTATGERLGYTDTEVGAEFVAFPAKAGHTYVLSTTGKTNNCAFCSAEFAIDQEVTVDVKPWVTPDGSSYNFDSSEFTLVDTFLGNTVAKVNKDTTSVTLNVGHTYQLVSADAGVGVKFVSTDSDKIKVEESTSEIQLSLVEIPDVALSGDIITSDGAAHDLKSVKFVNMVSGNVTEATIVGNKYLASIKPGEYNTVIESDGYTTIDKVHVEGGQDNENNIYLKANDPSLINLPADIQKADGDKQVTYNSVDAVNAPVRYNNDTSIRMSQGDSITIPVSGKQKVSVAGWYSGTWNINGQGEVTTSSSAGAGNPTIATYFTDGTETSVTVTTTAEGANYLYWIKLDDVEDFDANNTVIQVPSEKFPTLKDANAYIARLNNRPDGEEGRMTIELTDDIEEQIVFTEPYVTVKGNGHVISWYYGVGSFYYSIDKGTGLYDEELYYDRYNSNEGDGNLWGGVAIIRGDHFIAEDTVFKNTYNYYVTNMDASDFVRSTGGLVTERVAGVTDVGIYSTKERSNAFYIDADDIQVYNCQILSSQDTFGRNGSANNGYHVYVKDSVIGGNVDYICGEFTAVFDNCELQWKTYTDTDGKNNDKIGYITAAKTSPYVFRNCAITKDDDNKNVTGQFGRTWGAHSNAAFLYTQTNGTIGADGWGEMTKDDNLTATFYDYCNFNGDDDAAPAQKYASKISEELVDTYTSDAILDVLTFVPVNFMSQDTTVLPAPTETEAYTTPSFKMLDETSDIRTAAYQVGNDTILVAAVSDLSQDAVSFVSASGKVIASTKWVYDAIQLDDDYTITSKDLGIDNGYIFAVRVCGVRSGYMTAEGCQARENDVENFKAQFGVVEEVADEAQKPDVDPVLA